MKILYLWALGLIVSLSAHAQDRGMGDGCWNKVEMCQGCHDMGMGMGMGMGRGETAPKLGGQHPAYLEKALKAYRSGGRAHPVMNRMASMLSDREIGEIARSYGSSAPRTVAASPAGETQQVCAACHGPDGNSVSDQFPRLAGQREAYLVAALRAYRDGRRSDAVMGPQAAKLSDGDIEQLAAFYAGRTGLGVKQPQWGGRWRGGGW